MDVEAEFVSVTTLMCEPSRAIMLWNLLDGRAYTAGELAGFANISSSAASNHLLKLLRGGIVKAEAQGRHLYYSFAKPEVAYAVESLAILINPGKKKEKNTITPVSSIRFCRSCYDHLAGYVGVKITEQLELSRYLEKSGQLYNVTPEGWNWFARLEIRKSDFTNTRRPLTRQCLDWSERRPHLAGQLGAVMFARMLELGWLKRAKHSREVTLTMKGKTQLYNLLGI